ncbi:hypothetical protein [Hymenobacter psychrotolerans]|uniref:Uncharacterized protein n=1 Tax=Hymenobacter psychrotolerans DSM 18569 TaxID=1121959 RepID=A0A1M7H3G7_9BACT|nr:hypothetical protein [Hymenobacter psychrotolerans]SHM22948.1 hypothetical protein SAMN02746009_04151 [Hymenobacter psychrotolerans DSM 18569]
MKPLSAPAAALPPVVLGVALTIGQNESLRRSLHSAFGLKTRAINLRIDPSMELVFLCETTLPGTLPCLAALTRPGVVAVTLREAYLAWQPDPEHPIGRGSSTLAVLASGNCFLTANSRKIHIAAFSERNVHSTHVIMEMQGRPNLLEYLRSDWFTLEISGTNRRRLTKPLAFSAVLEFDLQLHPDAAEA